jgi:hypothetical protein
MKKQLIIIGLIVLLITVGLSGCQEQSIHIRKLNVKPDNFVNMTEEQMKHFPHLKEAILTNKYVDITDYDDEEAELRGVLNYFDTNYICYQNEYYELLISYAD